MQAKDVLGDFRFLHLPLTDGVPIGDSPAESNIRWHQIGLEGEWEGHYEGAFSLKERDFEQMVAHQSDAGNDLLVDYEHGSLFTLFNPRGSEASGWADQLRMHQTPNGATLHARIRWTDEAAKQIKDRKFRYLSPTIVWRTRDRKTGADLGTSLHSIALTNTPFLEELPEVTLNSLRGLLAINGSALPPASQGAETMLSKEQFSELAQLVGLSADADPAAVLEAAKKHDPSSAALATILSALELDAGTAPEAVVRSIKALRATVADAPSREEFDGLKAQLNDAEATAALKQATTDGKIVASNKEWATALAKKDLAAFKEWAAAAPAIVPLQRAERAKGAGTQLTDAPTDAQIVALAERLPASEKKLALQLGLDLQAYAKRMYGELVKAYG